MDSRCCRGKKGIGGAVIHQEKTFPGAVRLGGVADGDGHVSCRYSIQLRSYGVCAEPTASASGVWANRFRCWATSSLVSETRCILMSS